jgi:hypothetical protein
MGLDLTVYVLRGVNITKYDKGEEVIDALEKLGYDVIYDAIRGEYCYVGEELGSCEEYGKMGCIRPISNGKMNDGKLIHDLEKLDIIIEPTDIKTSLILDYW